MLTASFIGMAFLRLYLTGKWNVTEKNGERQSWGRHAAKDRTRFKPGALLRNKSHRGLCALSTELSSKG